MKIGEQLIEESFAKKALNDRKPKMIAGVGHFLFALANDGTIWRAIGHPIITWERYPDLPQESYEQKRKGRPRKNDIAGDDSGITDGNN